MITLAGLSLVLPMLWATPGGMKTYVPGFAPTRWSADLPIAFALQYVERFLLNAMNVETSRKSGWQRPFEHRRVLGVFSGHEERHRLAGQGDCLGFARH